MAAGDPNAASPAGSLGLRHLHLLVSDQARSVDFYQRAFGMEVMFHDGPIAFLRSVGRSDNLALHQAESADELARVGQPGGIEHFGISVADPARMDEAIALVEAAGGALLRRGADPSGDPYAYVSDPDGYVIEL
jgi:catechol 2,3-dioxygenase-like lactoylglutathione lyase family enzyme